MSSLCFFYVFFLIGFAGLSFQVSSPEDTFYTAAVVEFAPAKYRNSSLQQLNENLRGYQEILQSDEAAITDIIVFPELSLNNVQHLTYVPDPKHEIIPCNNPEYEEFFQELSCTAKNIRKYVVINVLEKENCTIEFQVEINDPRSCAENGLNIFNTNVAFNRKGMVIARYRKYNSYDKSTNVTYNPELSTFDTDFGVKFGMFICFDINFYYPAIKLVKSGVKDFIFSSLWFSELPFLTAVQLHQSWAYANEVNLLAAGASFPQGGTTGSGIYSGRQGALVSVMARSPERRLYIANVTKSSHWNTTYPSSSKANGQHKRNTFNGLRLMREYRLDAYTSIFLDPLKSMNIQKELCHASFCCHFNLKLKQIPPFYNSSSYKYHLAVFDEDRNYSGFGYTKYKVCAIFACTDKSLDSCGKVFDDNIQVTPELVFEQILIQGSFPKADKVLIMPNSLDQNLNPLTTERFIYNVKDDINTHYVNYSLSSVSDDLLTFGIYANYYNRGVQFHSNIITRDVILTSIAITTIYYTFRMCY